MASPLSFTEGIKYRDLILTEATNVPDSKNKMQNTAEHAAHKEYVKSQKVLRYKQNIMNRFPAIYQMACYIRRTPTNCVAPPRCTCAKEAKWLLRRVLARPQTTDDEFLELSVDIFDDVQEDSKAAMIYYGSIYYCRHLITGQPVRCWAYIAPFLRGMVKFIIDQDDTEGIDVRTEISRRLQTKNKIIIDQICVNLWILRMYDVLYGLHQETPQFSQPSLHYMRTDVANELFLKHSCGPTTMYFNVGRVEMAEYYALVNPKQADELVERYVEDSIDRQFINYLPAKHASSYTPPSRTKYSTS